MNKKIIIMLIMMPSYLILFGDSNIVKDLFDVAYTHQIKASKTNDNALKIDYLNKAIKKYSEVIDHVKEYKGIQNFYKYVPYYNRGLCWNDLNKYQKAIDDYTLALSVKSNYPECYYARGLVYFQLGNIEEAKSDFKKYMNSKPPESHINYILNTTGFSLKDITPPVNVIKILIIIGISIIIITLIVITIVISKKNRIRILAMEHYDVIIKGKIFCDEPRKIKFNNTKYCSCCGDLASETLEMEENFYSASGKIEKYRFEVTCCDYCKKHMEMAKKGDNYSIGVFAFIFVGILWYLLSLIFGIGGTLDVMLGFMIFGTFFIVIAIPFGIIIKINKKKINKSLKSSCNSSGLPITEINIISSTYYPPLAETGKSFVTHSSPAPFSMIRGPVPSKEDLGYTEHTCKCMLYNKMFVNDFIYKNEGKIVDTEKKEANNIPSHLRSDQDRFLCNMYILTWSHKNYIFSPNLKRVAHWEPPNTLYINDRFISQYNGITTGMKFSPDGKSLAYGAYKNRGAVYQIDFRAPDLKIIKGKDYEGIINGSIVYSPDGRHLAYGAKDGNMQFITYDDVEQKRLSGILGEQPVFSPDSCRLAYGAQKGSKYIVIVDDKESEVFDGIVKPIDIQNKKIIHFDYTGNHFAFVGLKSGTCYVVKDFEIIDSSEAIRWLAFQPGTEKLAYLRKKGDKFELVIDNEIVSKHLSIGGITFSLNGKRLAYAFSDKSSLFTSMTPIIDNKVLSEMDQIFGFAFSENNKRCCCFGKRLDKSVVLLDDGTEWEHLGEIKRPGIIPNAEGSHFTYCVRLGNRTHVVIDGDIGTERVEVLMTPIWIGDRRIRYPIVNDSHSEDVILVEESIS